MAIQRIDVERALDELCSNEGGMRFQGLAVVLGKQGWPELIAHQRKKDFGLDAYAPASETPEKVGKGLAASLTASITKVSGDAKCAKKHFPDLRKLLFVTPAKVSNSKRRQWIEEIRCDYGLELLLFEREEVITRLMTPGNGSLCSGFLYLNVDAEPDIAELIDRTKHAAAAVTHTWAEKTKGLPLIELSALRLDPDGKESSEVLSLEQVDQALAQRRRIVLEGPAGRGKTTTLIQLAQRARAAGTAFIVNLPSWSASRKHILKYIAGMPAFQAIGVTSTHLARVLQTEPFLLLLNGWNEIAKYDSSQASDALRELEREFPSAGIIVATRAHHLTPPLPGALRLRLLPLRREQRADYLAKRLGAKGAELRSRIDADPSLEGLTRTPFILSEVTTLFEAGAEIPSTNLAILAQVLSLHERREEHQNSLQEPPIYGHHADYLRAVAVEMICRGSVALPEAEASKAVADIARDLVSSGRIEPVGALRILSSLTAHHVLERVEYPEPAFQFEHQQLQEHYAALDVLERLLYLRDDDHDAILRFTADYVNNATWTEPLRMLAESCSQPAGDALAEERKVRAGAKLVGMALEVDLVFAGELALLCGVSVWQAVRESVGERLRNVYSSGESNFRQHALAAMLATGSDDFRDIILPLLSGEDEQARLRTYRIWPDLYLSSLGANWREEVRAWSEPARQNFVFELLHRRFDEEVASFAEDDDSTTVKEAAAAALIWTRSGDALTCVLESMDERTFQEVALKHVDCLPLALRPKAIAAMWDLLESTPDRPARIRTALHLLELEEQGLDDVLKDSVSALPRADINGRNVHYLLPALEHLHSVDPEWASEWVASQIAEGFLHRHDDWLRFATCIPHDFIEDCLRRLETDDLGHWRSKGMIAIVVTQADAEIPARVFARLRALQRTVDSEPHREHQLERKVTRQLEDLLRSLPDDLIATAVLASAACGDPLDINVTANLLSRVARSDVEPLCIADHGLRSKLRAYVKDSVDLVLSQADYDGREKANLASAIAQVGRPEDLEHLVELIRADIERVRRGIAARLAGDCGLSSNGASFTYAEWHIGAVMQLDPVGGEQVLIDLLQEDEYSTYAAAALARPFVPKTEHPFDRTFPYHLVWAAREGKPPPAWDGERRPRIAAALKAEMERQRTQTVDAKPAARIIRLASALAAIDGRGSAETVLEAISAPVQWEEHSCLDAAERLLIAGAALPAATVFALVDAVLARGGGWLGEQDRHLLCRVLLLCPFVDDPGAGIAKMRDFIDEQQLWGHELCELVTALGESRSEDAIDFLTELGSDVRLFEQCEERFINAAEALDSPRARDLLLGCVDPDVRGFAAQRRCHGEDVLVARLAELAQRYPEVAERFRELCERGLPERNRHLLSRVLKFLGTPEALLANLSLIDDAKPQPIPQGVWEQHEAAFVERKPYGEVPNTFTLHARASNVLRAELFRMALEDGRRRKSALILLGRIEVWRLEYGRPRVEPRHPDLASGESWPVGICDLCAVNHWPTSL